LIHLVREWIGGGEAVALASIEALKEEYDVTLVGVTKPDLERLNPLFGTALCWSEFRFLAVPPSSALTRLVPARFEFVHQLLHPLSFCRSLARHYDVMISTYNDMDLGKPGIQYCHHPWMAMAFQPEIARRVMDPEDRLPRMFWARSRLNWTLVAASGYRDRRVRANLTLANSKWTARIMEQAYGHPVRVVYPPVADIPRSLPWGARDDGFVCIGRFVRSKRIEDVVAILDGVRERGFDVHLYVASSYVDRDYLAELSPALRARGAWVHLEWNLSQLELAELISRHRYGLHAMRNEHFGMAVAEMVKGGMIPFVSDSGGQVEIVEDSRLRFATIADAVAKVVAVLGDRAAQQGLREHLARQGTRFSKHRFDAELRDSVAGHLEGAATRS
jgi:glycosyltransferase involved in cell wall biosynthesis